MKSILKTNKAGNTTFDRRREKRLLRIMKVDEPVYNAWCLGEWRGMQGYPYRNIYPAGKRHDEFKRGFGIGEQAPVAAGTLRDFGL